MQVCAEEFDRIRDERDVESLNERTESFKSFVSDKKQIARNYQELSRLLDEEPVDKEEVGRLAGFSFTNTKKAVEPNNQLSLRDKLTNISIPISGAVNVRPITQGSLNYNQPEVKVGFKGSIQVEL